MNGICCDGSSVESKKLLTHRERISCLWVRSAYLIEDEIETFHESVRSALELDKLRGVLRYVLGVL